MSKIKEFLISQNVDDVGHYCVDLEISLVFVGIGSLFDLGLSIIFASLNGSWFWGILVAVCWICYAVAGIILPLQRRTRALPAFAIISVCLSVSVLAFYIYELVVVARGKMGKGAVATFSILFIFWILRYVAIGFVCAFCLRTVRAVPTNKARASKLVGNEDETTGAYSAPAKPRPSPAVEPQMTL